MLLAQWAMIPGTVEHGEWRTGIRGEGVIFGVEALAQTVALALAVGAVGQILEAVGFVANQARTPRTLDGL
nr:MFS transporter [Burkholderia sp. lig30]